MNQRKKYIILVTLAFTTGFFPKSVKAQFAVHDPINFSQLLLEYSEHLKTVGNTFNTFEESRKIFEQGKKYYDSLQEVHTLIKNARQVKESVGLSLKAIEEYRNTYSSISATNFYTRAQLDVYNRQQSGIMEGMASVMEDMTKVVTNTGMSMSDKERMDAIDENYSKMVALFNRARGNNMQMQGEYDAVKAKKDRKRLERELLK